MGITLASGQPARARLEGRPPRVGIGSGAIDQPAHESRRRFEPGWSRAGPRRCRLATTCWRCSSFIATRAYAKIAKPWPPWKRSLDHWHRCWRGPPERERAEELSRQQEILLGSVADGICGVDRNGLVRFANPAAARLLGAAAAKPDRQAGSPAGAWFGSGDKKCAEDCPLRRASGNANRSFGEERSSAATAQGSRRSFS